MSKRDAVEDVFVSFGGGAPLRAAVSVAAGSGALHEVTQGTHNSIIKTARFIRSLRRIELYFAPHGFITDVE